MVILCNLHHLKQTFLLKVNAQCTPSLTNATQYSTFISHEAPPHSPLFTCSLTIADGSGMTTFHWGDIDNAIDHYCIMTSPSTSCSMCNISPNVPYQCPHLQTGHPYSFSVKAVNCENQLGGNSTFMINLISEKVIILFILAINIDTYIYIKGLKFQEILKLRLCITG